MMEVMETVIRLYMYTSMSTIRTCSLDNSVLTAND